MASGARVRNVQTVNDATDPITLASYVCSDWADRIMVACINVMNDGADRTVNAVDFNTSEGLTQRESHFEVHSLVRYYTQIWDLQNPTATTANVVADLSANASGASMTVFTLTGAKQQAPEAVNDLEDVTHPHAGTVTTITNNSRVIYTMQAERGGSNITALTANGGVTEIAETEIDTSYAVFSGTAHELQVASGAAAGGLDENGSGTEVAHQYAVAAYEAVDPLTVPGCIYWHRPDDTDSLTITSGDVTDWTDVVGDVTIVDEGGIVNYTSEAINGQQALEFPGTSEALDSSTSGQSVSHGIGTGNFYWVIVLEFDTVSEFQHIWSLSDGATTFTMGVRLTAGGEIELGIDDTDDIFTGLTPAVDTPCILELWREGTGAGQLKARLSVDGSEENDTAASSSNMSTAAGVNEVYMGVDPAGGPNDGLNGHAGDIIMYDGLPTSGERDRIRDYLDAKYSITTAGPGPTGNQAAAVFGI